MYAAVQLEVLYFTHGRKFLWTIEAPKHFGDIYGCHGLITQFHPRSWKAHTSSSALSLIHEHGATTSSSVIVHAENNPSRSRLFRLTAFCSFEVTFLDYSVVSLKLL